MSIALCAIGGAAIASPGGTESPSNVKVPPKRRTLAKPDTLLLPEAR